jgi:peptidoglycan hydrolase CwlO-like protein
MKKTMFTVIFVSTHLMFIFLHIYKNALFTQESFIEQRYHKELKEIQEQQQVKNNELLQLQNQTEIAAFAQQELGLVPLNLNQLRRLS